MILWLITIDEYYGFTAPRASCEIGSLLAIVKCPSETRGNVPI